MKEVILKKDVLLILKNEINTTADEELRRRLCDIYYLIAYCTGMRW